MVQVSFLYDDMCRNNNECRIFFVHDCTFQPFLPISKETPHNDTGIKLQQYVQYPPPQKKNSGGKTLSRTLSAQKGDYSLPQTAIGTPSG